MKSQLGPVVLLGEATIWRSEFILPSAFCVFWGGGEACSLRFFSFPRGTPPPSTLLNYFHFYLCSKTVHQPHPNMLKSSVMSAVFDILSFGIDNVWQLTHLVLTVETSCPLCLHWLYCGHKSPSNLILSALVFILINSRWKIINVCSYFQLIHPIQIL